VIIVAGTALVGRAQRVGAVGDDTTFMDIVRMVGAIAMLPTEDPRTENNASSNSRSTGFATTHTTMHEVQAGAIASIRSGAAHRGPAACHLSVPSSGGQRGGRRVASTVGCGGSSRSATTDRPTPAARSAAMTVSVAKSPT
jgi:hypothetical protein